MGLFRRRRNDGDDKSGKPGMGASGTPDASLTMFSEAEADAFRSTVRSCLAEMGYEVDVYPDRVVTDDGSECGLWNVAANAHNDEAGRSAWPDVITNHFGVLFANRSVPSPLEEGLDATLASAHLRIVDSAQLPPFDDGPAFGYAAEFAPGLLELIVLDTPTTVLTPAEDALTKVAPLATLLDRGRRNTRALLDHEIFQVELVEHEGQAFTCVMGESVFTASMALFLPEAVSKWQPGADLSEGIVFSIPFRNQLNFAVASPATSALDGLMRIPNFTRLGHSDSAGGLSPHTYYWRDGAVSQLTEFTGEVGHVTLGPDLERILATLDEE